MQYLRIMLSIQTKDRMEKDIDIMEKCTSFLFFFQNIKLDDPENEYDSHRRTCQCLKHEEHNKGYFICKYSTLFLIQMNLPTISTSFSKEKSGFSCPDPLHTWWER